jgi:hypothetical protein
MNDNKKIRAPKLAITKPMVDAGKELLTQMLESPESHTDDALVAGIFFRMWEVYWLEVMATQRKKATVHPLIIPTGGKLIIPQGMH